MSSIEREGASCFMQNCDCYDTKLDPILFRRIYSMKVENRNKYRLKQIAFIVSNMVA